MSVTDESSVATEANSRGPEWALVQRIVISPGFNKSVFLTNFLTFICDLKLQGRESEINEYQIGIHAFGRPETYNPAEDNIVRSYARTLRQRLEAYFAEEGVFEAIQIVIPRGSYVPHFEVTKKLPRSPVGPALFPPPVPDIGAVAEMDRLRKTPAMVLWVICLVSAVGVLGYRHWTHQEPRPFFTFWNQMLDPRHPNMVVLADSGLGMLQDISGHQIHLHEYVSDDPDKTFSSVGDAIQHAGTRYGAERFKNLTSTADIRSLMDLVQLPQFPSSHARVRYARDIRMDDLSNANVIIIGGPRANPWVELYEPVSDFRLEISNNLNAPDLDKRVVINKKPMNGENVNYESFSTPEGHENHSILSYLPSVDGNGHALLFQGGNMGATQAAADFATDATAMEPILSKASLPDGSFRPFEVLLETRVVGASSPKARVLTVHYR